MVEAVCYVDVALWLVPVTLESITESTGPPRGVVKHQLTLEPLIAQLDQ